MRNSPRRSFGSWRADWASRGRAIRNRQNTAMLNETDWYNEIYLPPVDPVLVDQFMNVDIRRAARGIAFALEESGADAELQRNNPAVESLCLVGRSDDVIAAVRHRCAHTTSEEIQCHALRGQRCRLHLKRGSGTRSHKASPPHWPLMRCRATVLTKKLAPN